MYTTLTNLELCVACYTSSCGSNQRNCTSAIAQNASKMHSFDDDIPCENLLYQRFNILVIISHLCSIFIFMLLQEQKGIPISEVSETYKNS